MSRNVCCLLWLFFPAMWSCRREEIVLQPLERVILPVDIRVNDMTALGDSTWIICGGYRYESGYIFRTLDHGIHFSSWENELAKSIYCVHFLDDSIGFAGGDQLHLWKTSDGGSAWQLHWLADQVPFNGEDRPAVRQMCLHDSSNWYFVGGENLGEGVLYETHDGGDNWNFRFVQHELRALTISEDGLGVASGHGASFRFDQTLENLSQTTIDRDFIAASVMVNHGQLISVSQNGYIYRSTDEGFSWNVVLDGNKLFRKRTNWNDALYSNGVITAVGNDGRIAQSTDDGNSWSHMHLADDSHLFCVAALGGQIWSGSENGKLYRLQ